MGSAVAHRLVRGGYRVVIHDVATPAAPRRGMAFTDAVFEGAAALDGVAARRVDDVEDLADGLLAEPPTVAVTTGDLEAVLAAVSPAVLVDARMRKRATPEPQRGLAPLTIGLGPNFVAGDTTDLVVETSWGDRLGAVLSAGASAPLAGEPRTYGGHARDRFVYAPAGGLFRTSARIAEPVRAGQVVATLDGAELLAPLDGILRGLTHDGVVVERGAKCIEVDPRGEVTYVTGIGERPGRIGDAVVAALRQRGI